MTNKFKVGDKVRQIDDSYINYNLTAIITGIIDSGRKVLVKWLEPCDAEYFNTSWDEDCFVLVEKSNKKPKQIDKHLILKNSCGNYETIMDSYKECVEYLNDRKISEAYTIYKLVAVAEMSPSIKITKIKSKTKHL